MQKGWQKFGTYKYSLYLCLRERALAVELDDLGKGLIDRKEVGAIKFRGWE